MKSDSKRFPPLETVTSPKVDTAAAAYYLNRKKGTLLGWACNGNGPISPIRIHGRLGWDTQKIRELVEGVTA